MSAPVLSSLREPPVVGRFYMVPVVYAEGYAGMHRDLPVLGPSHTDLKHFNFSWRHYHVDARFLTALEAKKIASTYGCADVHYAVGRMPLSNNRTSGVPNGVPKLAMRRCRSIEAVYLHGDEGAVQALRKEFGEPNATEGNMPKWQSLLIAGFRKGRHEPFNPLLNRHTGEPHQHSREIARRLRQSV